MRVEAVRLADRSRPTRADHATSESTAQAAPQRGDESMQARNEVNLAVNPVRRQLTALLVLAALAHSALAAAGQTMIEVWKDPSCGCCKDWVKHLEANGFKVKTNDSGNSEARARLGVPIDYAARHTAEVGGYAIEGHVPAREIQRLLK